MSSEFEFKPEKSKSKNSGLGLMVMICLALVMATGLGFYAWTGMGGKSMANLPATDQPAVAGWQPQRPIELVIMAGTGGGADRLARFIQSIIEKNGYTNQPIVPVNMGGQSGGEALTYLKNNVGNPHVVMMTLNSLYTTPLRDPSLGVFIGDFTPIARMAEDTFLLWVNTDSGITTIDEYVAAARAAGPDNWQMGGTGSGAEDSLVTGMLEDAYGIKHSYVPFKGGGTVAQNLIDGNVNATVNNPSEQMAYYKAGKSRPLAAFTPMRLPAFPDVPTFRELGHELVYFMQRSIVAPPGIPKEAQAFYQQLFHKVYLSKDWQKYAAEKSLKMAFLPDEPLMAYFIDELTRHRRLLQARGEIQ